MCKSSWNALELCSCTRHFNRACEGECFGALSSVLICLILHFPCVGRIIIPKGKPYPADADNYNLLSGKRAHIAHSMCFILWGRIISLSVKSQSNLCLRMAWLGCANSQHMQKGGVLVATRPLTDVTLGALEKEKDSNFYRLFQAISKHPVIREHVMGNQ